MPEYSSTVQGLIDDLLALPAAGRKPSEFWAFYYPAPDGTTLYSSAAYDELGWWPGLADAIEAQFGSAIPLTVTLLPGAPFTDVPRTASIGDDSVDLTFSDLDGEFSERLMTYGEGVRVELFGYYPGVDLLLSLWRGLTKAPKEMSRDRVKLSASTGFRSPNMNLPRRPHATSCQFIFGGLLATQAEIDFHKGCPYNKHLGGSVGVNDPLTGLPYTDCPRSKLSDCSARLVTKTYWPGFDVRADPIQNFVRGRNIPASAQGNASNLADPVRVVIGTRHVRSLPLLAYRNEVNTAHPDKGFGSGLFEVCEGPVQSLWNFYMNGVFVGFEHQNLRRGELGQPATFFSPNVNSFSGTAHAFGRIQGNFNSNQAASLTGSIMCQGLRNIRVYSNPTTYTEAYTTNRMWAILEALTNARWGYGNDYSRYDLQSAIDAADWCDETVSMHDPNGNLFTGTRSTCNVELNSRSVQQQVNDLCVAGRIGLPFEFQGKDVFVPLREEDTEDPDIPTFTDEGAGRNIVYEGGRSTLTWSQVSDAEMPNQWTVNFDDYSNGGVETQLIFGDQRQQLRAGRAYGDRSVRVVNKSQPALGITNFSEAARLGNFLLYLGPLDAGGIANNCEVRFTTYYSHAFNVRNYGLIRVLNAKLQARLLLYFQSLDLPWFDGGPFAFFRVKKVMRRGDLKVEVTAQLYAHDLMAEIEDVLTPPPVFVSPGGENPGGRRDEQPETIQVLDLTQDGDRILGRFAESVY